MQLLQGMSASDVLLSEPQRRPAEKLNTGKMFSLAPSWCRCFFVQNRVNPVVEAISEMLDICIPVCSCSQRVIPFRESPSLACTAVHVSGHGNGEEGLLASSPVVCGR